MVDSSCVALVSKRLDQFWHRRVADPYQLRDRHILSVEACEEAVPAIPDDHPHLIPEPKNPFIDLLVQGQFRQLLRRRTPMGHILGTQSLQHGDMLDRRRMTGARREISHDPPHGLQQLGSRNRREQLFTMIESQANLRHDPVHCRPAQLQFKNLPHVGHRLQSLSRKIIPDRQFDRLSIKRIRHSIIALPPATVSQVKNLCR